MPLNTDIEFNSKYRVDAYASSDDVIDGLWAAYDRLIDYVGLEVVTDAAAAVPTDLRRARRLKRAEREFAYGEIALRVGSRLREAGIVDKESNIMGDNAVDYLDPDAVEKYIQMHDAIALRELEEYRTYEVIEESAIVSTLKYW